MTAQTPHFLLFARTGAKAHQGEWRFVLQTADGSERFEAADRERETCGERLELLAVVRGLEALGQPSRVTLVSDSRYVERGLTFGLDEWRHSDWTWERYGEMVPVKNADLWRRLDRALGFHELRLVAVHRKHANSVPRPHVRFAKHRQAAHAAVDGEHHVAAPRVTRTSAARRSSAPRHTADAPVAAACVARRAPKPSAATPGIAKRTRRRRGRRAWIAAVRWSRTQCESVRLRLAQLGTGLLPAPWLD